MMQIEKFIDPDRDLYVNFAISVVVIQELSRNMRARPVLDIDKFGMFSFLVSHPTVLNRFINNMDGTPVYLEDSEIETIRAMNPNVELVLNRQRVSALLQHLILHGLVTVVSSGKLYIQLSENGELVANESSGWFLNRTRVFARNLKPFSNESATKILDAVIKSF